MTSDSEYLFGTCIWDCPSASCERPAYADLWHEQETRKCIRGELLRGRRRIQSAFADLIVEVRSGVPEHVVPQFVCGIKRPPAYRTQRGDLDERALIPHVTTFHAVVGEQNTDRRRQFPADVVHV